MNHVQEIQKLTDRGFDVIFHSRPVVACMDDNKQYGCTVRDKVNHANAISNYHVSSIFALESCLARVDRLGRSEQEIRRNNIRTFEGC